MASAVALRPARPEDAKVAARFAATKREEYERYAPVFWRRAHGAGALHEVFLAQCLSSGGYTALCAERDGDVEGIVMANHRVTVPPFIDDPEPSWLIDDFYLAQPARWPTAGGALLTALAVAAREAGQARLIVVTAQRDGPKRSFLLDAGYERAAAWWVHEIQPTPAETPPAPPHAAPLPPGVQAMVGPAPPVYDPGGPVALALALDTSAVAAFDAWAAESHAVLGIVPARSSDLALQEALGARGYAVASEWFVRAV